MLPVRIFIVDDDVDEFIFFYNAFKNEDVEAELSFFRNPEGLIPYLDDLKQDEFPDLIVSDLNMPKVTGYQLLDELKSSEKYVNIPVVICSTLDDPAHSERCKGMGAHDYILKPFHFSEYKQIVEKIVSHCLKR